MFILGAELVILNGGVVLFYSEQIFPFSYSVFEGLTDIQNQKTINNESSLKFMTIEHYKTFIE